MVNVDDVPKINQLLEIRDKCIHAIDGLNGYLEEIDQYGPDVGGLPGYEYGFWANFSTHVDGSGPSANMNGCYVGIQAANALIRVLINQIERVEADLRELGIYGFSK